MLQLSPLKPGLTREIPLEVLLRLDPDQLPPNKGGRVPLNLALVLDRSGSMRGEKLELTKEAACRALDPLNAKDHLSLVIFDDRVDSLYNGPVKNKAKIEALIRGVEARNNTNLCGGWLQGAQELAKQTRKGCLSRVILLTDGEANEGVVEPAQICSKVASWCASSVQTTTLGFGAGYNQNLLKQMASDGGGNHGYIEDASRLAAFFDEEMTSLVKARGTQVRVQIALSTGGSVQWLVKPGLDREGRVCLGNLVQGQPLALVFRWNAEHASAASSLNVTVSWNDLHSGQSRQQHCQLELPLLDRAQWEQLACDPQVQAQVARAQVELRRQGATQLLEQEQYDAAFQWLGWALELPGLPEDEKATLIDLQQTVARRDLQATLKKAAMYSHGHGHGHARVSSHYAQSGGLELDEVRRDRPRLSLPLGDGPILHHPWEWPAAPWRRLEGMLRGHFFGERLVRGDKAPLGEGAALTMTTLRHQIKHIFHVSALAEQLHSTPLLHPTTSQQRFRRSFEKGNLTLLEIGSDSAGCAALRRICPFLVAYRGNPLISAILATMITHRDNLALTACVGYLSLLSQLLRLALLPPKEFYLNTFCAAVQGLAQRKYSCETGKFKGWSGYVQDFLQMAIQHAREQSLDLAQAMKCWGSGPYLLEVLPNLLYALELHAHEPWPAMLNVSNHAHEADTLAMLTGAALGALHGSQPGWFLDPEVDKLLDEVKALNY
jgi:Ca-activated chloride channel family protein